jgi:hypothetical protein
MNEIANFIGYLAQIFADTKIYRIFLFLIRLEFSF